MDLLGGGAAALFGELLSPLYHAGTVTSQAAAYDAKGDMQRTATARDCRVQVDRVTERMVAAEGYTITDQALYVLASSLDGNLDSDCEVTVNDGPHAGNKYRVASPIDRDPACAYWLCRGVAA